MAMARTVFCLSSPFQTSPCLISNPNSQSSLLLHLRNPARNLQLKSSPARIRCVGQHSFSSRFQFSRRSTGFSLRATKVGGTTENDDVKSGIDEDKEDAEFRGVGTTPERFKFEAVEEPVTLPRPPRWALIIALACFIYTWRMVLWELGNWKNSFVTIISFLASSLQFILSLLNDFLGDPITYILYTIRSFYSSIISSAPIPELTTIVMLASAVLAISEATSPNSLRTQPYLLTASGIIGYAAVSGYISEPFFWTTLLGLFCIAKFVKKRDYVASALPVATVLASVGEPWVRAVSIVLFTGLAVYHNWRNSGKGQNGKMFVVSERRLPLPLVAVALAIGMRLAAQWAGYRHLTWKVV